MDILELKNDLVVTVDYTLDDFLADLVLGHEFEVTYKDFEYSIIKLPDGSFGIRRQGSGLEMRVVESPSEVLSVKAFLGKSITEIWDDISALDVY